MSEPYDTVVVGAGHNGLTAAAVLAKSGQRVLVVERRSVAGGMSASEEFFPGYRTAGLQHDTTGVRRHIVEELDLDRHGLRFAPAPPDVFVPQPGGLGFVLHHDPEEAAGEILRYSEKDAEAYRSFREFLSSIRGPIESLLNEPLPVDPTTPGSADRIALLKRVWSLRRLGENRLMELLRIVPMSVRDWLEDWFEGELLKAALAAPALHGTMSGPRSPASAANLLLRECVARGSVVGGPAVLSAALLRAATGYGVEIRTEAEVERIRVRDGRVEGMRLTEGEDIDARCVATSCDPRHALLDLLPGGVLGYRLAHRIRHYRGQGTTAAVHLALDRPPEMEARPGERFGHIRIGAKLEDLERAFDPVKYGEIPDSPILDIHIPTNEDPSLAPSGHAVASILVHFVPYRLKGGWDDGVRERLTEIVLNRLESFTPALRASVIGLKTLTPADLKGRYGLVEGHIHHGEHALDQRLVRPVPECYRYHAPIAGLVLCGSGSHPGGGITCAPGYLAAKEIIRRAGGRRA